jgi:hypothetical protein
MKMLLLFVTASVLLSACDLPRMTSAVSETELALCDAWQRSLPTRSHLDTRETIELIGVAYDTFESVCRRPALPE